MRRSSIDKLLVAACLIVVIPALAVAQGAAPGTVTGHGLTELKRPPEILRVQVDILARGKDLPDALAQLKARREAALKQLDALGAIKSSISFGEPQVTSEKTDRQRQMEAMVKARMRVQGKKTSEKEKQAAPVIVAVALKAMMPLKNATPDELLVLANALQEKIKAADLGGTKALTQRSPQEEELAEEAVESGMMGGDNEPKRGEPMFMYVSKISRQDQDKALADAFQEARREAGRLARAAGAELGALHHLENNSPGISGSEEGGPVSSQYYYQMQQARMIQGDYSLSDQRAGEAISTQPGKAVFRVAVTAAFVLKTPAKE